MAGYVRQAAASIVTGADILAAPLNAEFNQIQSFANGSTGHGHSGGTGDGPKISLTAAAAVTGTLPVANGGTGAATAALARDALGLTIGTNVQAWDTDLDGLAALTYGADLMSYSTAAHAFATTSLTSFARTILDDADAGTAQTTLGISAFVKTILDDADATAVRATIGAVIGTNVQAYDADLAALAANSTDGLWAHTGAGTGSARTLTAPAAGFSITNPAGIAGNPTFVLANDLAALEAMASNGIVTRTASETYSLRTVTGTAAELTVTNGDGVSGNPTLSLPSALTFTGKTITGGTFASITMSGTHTNSGGTFTDLGIVSTADINGGTIDGVIIGGSSTAAGSFTTVTASGNITGNSDARLKYNVETIDGALDKVLKIRGVFFNRKSDDDRNIGVIAQELKEIVPEMVKQNGEYLSVDYGSGFAILVEAIKELADLVRK